MHEKVDLAIGAYGPPGMSASDVKVFRQKSPHLPMIATTYYGDAEMRGAICAGVTECLLKPFDPGRLFEVIVKRLSLSSE